MVKSSLSNLEQLESEAIHIIREVVAQATNPVMLYSIGKDSAVMLHLAKKAFLRKPTISLASCGHNLEISEMYKLRDKSAAQAMMDLIVFQNPEALKEGINPFDHGESHRDVENGGTKVGSRSSQIRCRIRRRQKR